ncbi:hypothetical protein DNL40_09515 [Xylanimonas oleitrophica]|uniref:Phosphatidate phosphatase APP1 catalytic domain-containing protein n=2 Tax=Xylanimonas oleitrophica TaxID=2607479 RepID=A0A2W5WP96_9MICO|nr:hypothetical protein DNL40_09515 [Xylanimonas oleitrophica]
MITAVPRLLVAAWNTLVVPTATRRPVHGMPRLYRRLAEAHQDAPFVYLSSGAWNTARTLRRFLARHAFPPGPLLLTDFGPTKTGWFRSGPEHKTTSLARLMDTFPHVRWVLVGDDGQHDPEVYSAAVDERPGQVAAVAIRTLTPAERVLSSGTANPARRPDGGTVNGVPVVVGPDGDALAARLEGVPGLLGPG